MPDIRPHRRLDGRGRCKGDVTPGDPVTVDRVMKPERRGAVRRVCLDGSAKTSDVVEDMWRRTFLPIGGGEPHVADQHPAASAGGAIQRDIGRAVGARAASGEHERRDGD
jgi:hypothetical protein